MGSIFSLTFRSSYKSRSDCNPLDNKVCWTLQAKSESRQLSVAGRRAKKIKTPVISAQTRWYRVWSTLCVSWEVSMSALLCQNQRYKIMKKLYGHAASILHHSQIHGEYHIRRQIASSWSVPSAPSTVTVEYCVCWKRKTVKSSMEQVWEINWHTDYKYSTVYKYF